MIGSGPAGVSAAEAFREHEPDAPVRIMTHDHDPPYARPPLSKEFLRGESDDVALHDRAWFDERDIEIHHNAVDELDVADHAVLVGGDRMPYDALVLACSAAPAPLPVPGGERALSLRSLADARALRAAANGALTAVVVGAGFIGCEAAASLALRGVRATVVAPEHEPQEKRLGTEAGRRLRELVQRSGATYLGGRSVREVTESAVVLDDGRSLACDLVLAATGVTPRIELAGDLDVDGGRIAVDAHMRTSAEDVFAAGDVALAHNAAAGRPLAVEHWSDAEGQGSVAGAAAAGRRAEWDAVPGFWTDIGDATVKYSAWGDGFDQCRLVEHGDGFTVWYERDGVLVGVLAHEADDDYDRAEALITSGASAPLR